MGKRRDPTESSPSAAPSGADAPSFEAALERLEALVDRLEQGDLELEAALAAFEEGVALARRCAAQLGDAERRIEVLLRQGGGWVSRPLEAPPEGEGEAE
jgi:exodeoxyribonuclease VII small subunit